MRAWTKAMLTAASVAALTPMPAFAHPMPGVGDFYAGMLHPLITIESVLPLVAFSLLAGQQRREATVPLLAAFPASLCVGTAFAALGGFPPHLDIAQLVLAAGLGILVAVAWPILNWILFGLCIVLGIFVGWANASEVLGQVSVLRFAAGFGVIGLLLLVYGNGVVRNLKAEWTRIAIRVVGSWIAAVSILVLGLK